tara:strand:- start:1057 stop:1230 length:174 start_codon:yes stop_codon:yes gene_type:complete
MANSQACQIKSSPQFSRFLATLPDNRAKALTQSKQNFPNNLKVNTFLLFYFNALRFD